MAYNVRILNSRFEAFVEYAGFLLLHLSVWSAGGLVGLLLITKRQRTSIWKARKVGEENCARKLMRVASAKRVIKETGKKSLPTNTNIPYLQWGTWYGVSSSFY